MVGTVSETSRLYNDPAGGTPSSVGAVQFNEKYWQKKALIEGV